MSPGLFPDKEEHEMKGNNKNNIQYLVDEKGKKVSVVLSVKSYEEILEDVADLAAIAERRNEKTTDHQTVISRLKSDGLL